MFLRAPANLQVPSMFIEFAGQIPEQINVFQPSLLRQVQDFRI